MLVITTKDGKITIEHFNNVNEMRAAAAAAGEKGIEGIEAEQKAPQ